MQRTQIEKRIQDIEKAMGYQPRKIEDLQLISDQELTQQHEGLETEWNLYCLCD